MVWPEYYNYVNGHFVRCRWKEVAFKALVVFGWVFLVVTSMLFAPVVFFGGYGWLK